MLLAIIPSCKIRFLREHLKTYGEQLWLPEQRQGTTDCLTGTKEKIASVENDQRLKKGNNRNHLKYRLLNSLRYCSAPQTNTHTQTPQHTHTHQQTLSLFLSLTHTHIPTHCLSFFCSENKWQNYCYYDIVTSTSSFLKIGQYLPPPLIIRSRTDYINFPSGTLLTLVFDDNYNR